MRLVTLLLLSILLLASCGNDDEPDKEGNCLTAVINGEDFVGESVTGVFVETTIEYENLGTQNTRILTITGTIPSLGGETKTIMLTFACGELQSELDYVDTDEDCGVGMSYSITEFLNPNGAIVVMPMTGLIVVQELSADRIKGTFTFSGEDQNGDPYNFTDGFFDTEIIQ
ncbi:MAG: hypothetical protein AAF573_15230 [Bacteroidota bacterium]